MRFAASFSGRVAANRIIRAVRWAVRVVAGRGVVVGSSIRVVHRMVVARHLACCKRVCRLTTGTASFICISIGTKQKFPLASLPCTSE